MLLLPLQLPVRVPAPPVQTVREDPTLGGCRPVNAVNVAVGASSGHCESPVDTSTGNWDDRVTVAMLLIHC